MNAKALCTLIEERQDELYELLCKLIRINSENFGSYGNEQACPEYIKQLCLELGLETEMYSPLDVPDYDKHPDYLDGRHLENRYNVICPLAGQRKHRCFDAHGSLRYRCYRRPEYVEL